MGDIYLTEAEYQELQQSFGRTPTDEEVFCETQKKKERIHEAQRQATFGSSGGRNKDL